MHWLTHRALWSASLPQSEGNAALLNNQRRKPHPLSCPLRREIFPLRSATVEMTIEVPANIVISSGDACRYGSDGKRFDDTLSPEISQSNAARTIRGRFLHSASLCRNDDRGARQYRHLERGDAPVWVLEGNRFDETLSREISQRNAARTMRGDFSTPQRFRRNDGGRAPFL